MKTLVEKLKLAHKDAMERGRGETLESRAAAEIERCHAIFERIVRMPMAHRYLPGCYCMGCVPKIAALEGLGRETP